MVNTVGSYKISKFWNKKWIQVKSSLSLTNRQKSIIIGSLLGDGTMRVGKNARNANFKVEHGLKQKKLVFWKYKELQNFVFTEPKVSFRYNEDGSRYPKSWWFRTIRHPELTEIYNEFYLKESFRTGKKIISGNDYIKSYLNPIALAVWVMDDGSFNRGIIDLSTYSFSLEDIKKLQSLFSEKFGLTPNFYKDRDKGFRMYFSRQNTNALIQIISPYFIESMKYKVNFVTP